MRKKSRRGRNDRLRRFAPAAILCERRERWALRAPRPAARDFIPCNPIGDITSWEEKTASACCWRIRKYELLAHRKPGKPQGKTSFPLGFLLGFPRMHSIRSGGFQPPGQKHNRDMFGHSFQQQREIVFFSTSSRFRKCRVQGGHLPGGGLEAKPPTSPLVDRPYSLAFTMR